METYTFMRQLADSWVLLAMFGFFIGAGIWAFLPSQRSARDDASQIPFRNDPEPSPDPDEQSTTSETTAQDLKGQPHV